MKLSGAKQHSRQIVTAGVGALLLVVMGGVLILGFRLATRMTTNIGAVQTASALQAYPDMLAQQLVSLRDRLEARAYAGQALADLKATAERFDHDLKQLAAGDFGRADEVGKAMLLWHQYGPVLTPVSSFDGQPYVDSDESGSSFSKVGLTHFGDVKRAQLFASENAKRLQALLSDVATYLQSQTSAQAARLRLLLSIGVLAALVLAAAAAYFQLTRGRSERMAREAQEQTRDILKTVKEGFFLLDADYRIGSVWSNALTRMFGRQDFSGLSFEELLTDRVPAQTLVTATKYIKLLWGDRAHENLMKSINPLGQLEIQVDDSRGGRDTRYLQFDFHRVMGEKGVKHVLVSVSDITSSVLLARELAESQQNANNQVDMMLGVMHLDPVQLMSFLDSTDAGLMHVNAILKEPARNDLEFRKKLDGLFRELHTIKGEASAVTLLSAAQRVHVIEDLVSELKKKPDLSGNDFLPLLLKLDELMAHLRSVRELATRLATMQGTPPSSVAVDSTHRAAAPVASVAGKVVANELSKTLNMLAERLSAEHRKTFKLGVTGLAEVPQAYQDTVKDVLIQMLRNAAVHGIETPEARRTQSKTEVGLVRVDFRRVPGGYELVCEDDGAGLNPNQLKAAAVSKQIVTAEEAAAMDNRAVMALIFKPGFSTQAEVSMDAGRGVGMDVVARSIYALNGKIGVATNPGKFTRFKIALPAVTEASSAVA
jgi:HPt (histidine-containing phosphotransfer) domain-containing protein/PAS domain-containing protein